MGRTPRDVTDTELAILQQLWDHGARTIRQLTAPLSPACGQPPYAPLQHPLPRPPPNGALAGGWAGRRWAGPARAPPLGLGGVVTLPPRPLVRVSLPWPAEPALPVVVGEIDAPEVAGQPEVEEENAPADAPDWIAEQEPL